jgi:hypothetical protein
MAKLRQRAGIDLAQGRIVLHQEDPVSLVAHADA